MKLKMLLFALLLTGLNLHSQDYFPQNDGVKSKNSNYTVFENARIHVDPNTIIENGMFAVKDGKITAVGKTINIPSNSVRIDLAGKEVYPSFIDIYSEFGIAKPSRLSGNSNQAQYEASREGYYWNDHIRPETNAVEHLNFNMDEAAKLHKNGFGVVNTHMADGIIRGTGVLLALTPEVTAGDRILAGRSAQYLSFEKSVQSRQSYPTSIMGAMALLRQSYLDADWYSKGNSQNKDLALEALNRNKNLVQIFKTTNLLDALRADKIANEFGVNYVILGSGHEYERIEEVKKSNATFIIPLNFPDVYDVQDPFMASYVNLQDMKRWNQAPANLKMLAENNVPFVITAYNLKDEKKFRENLLLAIEFGLDKKAALAALTTVPAKTIGQENKLGVLKEGAWANFLVTSGDVFDKESVIYENWVQGKRSILENLNTVDLAGNYDLKVSGNTYSLKITGKPTAPKTEVKQGDKKIESKITYSDGWMNLLLTSPDSTKKEFTRLVARVQPKAKSITGKAIQHNGQETTFTAVRTSDVEDKKQPSKNVRDVVKVTFPNMAYGFDAQPKQENILFKNATVWTNTNEGILENTDVLIANGKISWVGKGLNAGNARVIDATGKHLTSGIIDEHTHIAASAINEAGHNSTAEVAMEDVVDPTDINIYRNLAGGVTAVQLLHGSANPIGGRSAILKLKWGAPAEGMIFKEAPKFIKFALGENVKQSNRSNANRFPQSRMGVEQVFLDYFSRARNYEQEKKNNKNFRRDLEMETLVEILNGERYVTSHSYVQSEINMLMKVAEQFDFRINTFTHILEGYKVADKMKEHGVGASTFSDWWAYKYEVNDAIPYNAAILHEAGVTVAINSDDSEMSRRLNQEAAKSMKYGGITEEEAWKFVTLNPAKLMHIDQYVGSVEAGKHADVVLWSGHPLSVYSNAEKTLVEGVVYFDLDRDEKLREEMAKQKNLLTTQMLEAKNGGAPSKPVSPKEEQHIHCNTLEIH
ncbi:amidohydrolase family protein [Antarcticibacterium arcticum]|uniref:Amidohydrolase family protein n=1 Tax=Antarcticibacterium arcticum TaxID=2585771 RepID=A0A5B8YKT5_9FLAO|nr:amidohydrolase family protein [Antarcticibacterium arcticum]QED37417.1 amidohydrolase family protein [Antarcticibacterium arcticum]